jgi:hypothetical protein
MTEEHTPDKPAADKSTADEKNTARARTDKDLAKERQLSGDEEQAPQGPGTFAKEDPAVLRQVEVALQDGPVDEEEPSGNWKVVAPVLHNGEMFLPGDSLSVSDLETEEVPYSGESMLTDLVNSGAVVPEEQYTEPVSQQATPQEGEVWVNYRDVDNRPAGEGMGDPNTARYVMQTALPEPINVPKSEEQTGASVRVQPSAAREITNRNSS